MQTKIKNIVDFYKLHPELKGKIKVNTPYGYKKIIEAQQTDYSIPQKIITSSGKSLTGSKNHLIFCNNKWTKISDLKKDDIIETLSGKEKIHKKVKLRKKEKLYDIQVDEVKQYYSNGILSHNSSLIADSISFALYGKPLRGEHINKDELINELNKKNCEVSVYFKLGSDSYVVTRKIKPSSFSVYVNDNEIKFDSIKNTEKWLEEKLGISHTCFSNILVLNMNDTRPFLTMDASAKRKVIEDIMNMNVYGRMAELAKENHLVAKNDVRTFENDVRSSKDTLELATNSRANLEIEREKFENDKASKIKALSDSIENLEKEKATVEKLIENVDYDEEIKKLKEKRELARNTGSEASIQLATCKKSLNDCIETLKQLEKKPHCPTCHVPTDNPLVKKYITETTELAEKNKQTIDLLEQKIKKSNEIFSIFASKVTECEKKKEKQINLKNKVEIVQTSITMKIESLKQESLRQFNASSVISDDDIQKYKVKYEEANKSYENALRLYNYNGVLRKVLGEEGIRKFVLSKVLPFFNSKINSYLKIMGSDLLLKFNANLEEHIVTRNREERTYGSFSAGEKKRIDISVLMALMDLAKLQNSVDTNILVLDEVLDTAMDTEGVENFLHYLKEGFKAMYPDKAVYIITHRNTLSDDFYDKMIILQKKDGFTSVENIVDMRTGA